MQETWVPWVRRGHLVPPLGAEQGTPGGRVCGQKPEAQIRIPARPLTSRVPVDEHLVQAGFIIIRHPQAGGPHPDLQHPGCTVQACDSIQGIRAWVLWVSFPHSTVDTTTVCIRVVPRLTQSPASSHGSWGSPALLWDRSTASAARQTHASPLDP